MARTRSLGDSSKKPKVPTQSTATKFRVRPTSFDCANALWKKCLNHGSDQIDLESPFCDLNSPVHPMYHPRNWILEDFPNKTNTWLALEPALNVASKLLTSTPALAFFRRVKYGKKARAGGRMYLEYDEPENTTTEDAAVKNDLNSLAQCVVILFGAFKPEPREPNQDGARQYMSQEDFGKGVFIRGEINRLPADDGQYQYIILNEAFAAYAENSNPSPVDAIRSAFIVAVLLVHETAHAFYARDFYDMNENYKEPFFDLQQY
ncbi:hypothetical protein EK21DRAFT_73189, partial [Setomelanomma holmii]